MRNKVWRRRAAAALVVTVGVWSLLALDSGLFIPHDERWAVPPGEFSSDVVSQSKRVLELPTAPVAYFEVGEGPPLILLHGCPFSGFEWRDVLPQLAQHYRVIVPDLLGLGDTPVRLDQDYRLPHDVVMVRELMNALGIEKASFIGHDHGGATLQLLMVNDAHRIEKAILTNVEAYDQWPSQPEVPYLRAIVHPLTSPIVYQALKFRAVQKDVFSLAVEDASVLTDEVLQAYAEPHIATAERWQRLRRFFTWQMDEAHNNLTLAAVPMMRQFENPVLLVWGELDENFGPHLARRLARDIPGVQGIAYMKASQHMPMQEEPAAYAKASLDFLLRGEVTEDAKAALAYARQEVL